MRQVRMLGLCLIAVFSMTALSYAVASPAMAACNAECKQAKERAKTEKAVAKWQTKRVGDPYTPNSWGQMNACNYKASLNGDGTCYYGITYGGKGGGFFEYGKVRVPLNKSIALQGTFIGAEPNTYVLPAINGYETLDSPVLPVEGGLKLFTPQVQEEEEWPAALKESYKEALKNKESAVNVKIEMAGNKCFETAECIDPFNLIFREGPAFQLPLKVRIISPWLEKLKSGPCSIGNDEHPVEINLTSAGSGAAGDLKFGPEFSKIEIHHSRLVDTGWKIEPASDPTGCGGEYEKYIDGALDNVLQTEGNVNSRTGIVVLEGDLFTAENYQTEEYGLPSGELKELTGPSEEYTLKEGKLEKP